MKLRYLFWFLIPALISIITILIYFGLTLAPYVPQGFDTLHETDALPKIIAHKSKLNPSDHGDTMEDIQQILNSPITALEIDVRLTKDNVPVIYHGDGLVEDQDLSQLNNILTLEQVFAKVHDKKVIFLDIKDRSIFDKTASVKINALIDKYNLADTVVVESFNPFFLLKYRQIAGHKLIMYDFLHEAIPNSEESPEQLASIPWLIKQNFFQNWVRWIVRPDILGPKQNFPIAQMRAFRAVGYPVIVWTVDEPSQATMLFANGINGIQTNDPLHLINIPQMYTKIYDASRTAFAKDVEIVQVSNEQDILAAITKANKDKRNVSAFGRRHSQGGQSFFDHNILLNMSGYNSMFLLPDNTLRVQSGATWKQIQAYLNPLGRSVKIMQSDNIFSVGGSASVNVHGWQVSSGPLSSSIQKIKIMLADGTIMICAKDQNQELFSSVLGGYGLIGVILEIDLHTSPNFSLHSEQFVIKPEDYVAKYKSTVSDNHLAELAYGRLDVSENHMFDEAFLHVFYRDQDGTVSTAPIDTEALVAMKRQIFRTSERSEVGKILRWQIETKLGSSLNKMPLTRNFVMSPDIQVLWPLSLKNVDILHEYFIPKAKFFDFVNILKKLVKKHSMNLLNVTIREVLRDEITLLAYAKEDVFAFVLFFSQPHSEQGENAMHVFTEELVGEALQLDGSFYLPYRPHYTKEQLFKAYPNLNKFNEIKQKYDPNKLFINNWYMHYLN